MKLKTTFVLVCLTVGCNGPAEPPNNTNTVQGNNGSDPPCQSDEECRQWTEGPLRPDEAFCDDFCRDCRDDEDCPEGEYCAETRRWCRPFVTTSCETFEDCNPEGQAVRVLTCLDNQCVGCGPNAAGPNGVCPDGWICVGSSCAQAAVSPASCVDQTCPGECVMAGDDVICDDGDDCIKNGDEFVCVN